MSTLPWTSGLAPEAGLELLPDLSRLLSPSLVPPFTSPAKQWRTWLLGVGEKGIAWLLLLLLSRSARLNIQISSDRTAGSSRQAAATDVAHLIYFVRIRIARTRPAGLRERREWMRDCLAEGAGKLNCKRAKTNKVHSLNQFVAGTRPRSSSSDFLNIQPPL
jgi:hypothetical protein